MNENGSKKIVIKLSLENFLEPVLKVVKHAAGMVNVPIINQSGRVRCFWELLGKTVACSFSIGNVFIHLSSISNPWILAPVFVISALNAIFICTSTYSSLKNENDVNGKENNGSKSQGFILSERFNKGVVGLENIATNFVRSSGLTVKIPTLLTNDDAVVKAMGLETYPEPERRELSPDDAPSILLDPSRTFRDFGPIEFTPLETTVWNAVAYYREHGVTGGFTHLRSNEK